MKVVALVSGGKDSCYAMQRCIDYGHEVIYINRICCTTLEFKSCSVMEKVICDQELQLGVLYPAIL